MYGATIGRLAILGTAATVNQACCVFVPRSQMRSRFLYYYLWGMRPHLISMGYGGGQPNLSQELLKSIRIPTPPLKEQNEIIQRLDALNHHIQNAKIQTNRQIDLIHEYRTRLIADVVTGQIDVRTATIEVPDQHL